MLPLPRRIALPARQCSGDLAYRLLMLLVPDFGKVARDLELHTLMRQDLDAAFTEEDCVTCSPMLGRPGLPPLDASRSGFRQSCARSRAAYADAAGSGCCLYRGGLRYLLANARATWLTAS